MTKGADGSTRVISQPITAANKSTSDSPATKISATPQKEGPQKVQIIRAPNGKITVRGLLAGQQLIQMPDGKLHVVMAGQQGIAGQLVATSPATNPTEPCSEKDDRNQNQIKTVNEETRPTPTSRVTASPAQQIVLQGNRQLVVQPTQQVVVQQPQQVVVQPTQQVVVQAGARPALQPRMQAVQTVLVQGQILQRPPTPAAARATVARPPTPRPRPASTQQIVVNNPVLVQQIAAGKIQLATVNGQQVLIRPTGNNQAQIVAHIGQSASPAPAVAPAPLPRPAALPQPQPLQQPQQQLTEDELVEKRLLVGQPPGTVIKTVTAQVNNISICTMFISFCLIVI
jgi:nucleosome-remodeling factor subunit BPTF